MVFGQHYLGLAWGWTGVDIFFVLSGFLITGILFDTRNKPHRVWNFYIRRTLRIFPLYYGVFLAFLITWPIFKWHWNAWWLLWPAYLGNFARFLHPAVLDSPLQLLGDAQIHGIFRPGFGFYLGHFWSLCVEEQFYLLWPWVVFYVKDRRRLIAICVASIVASPLLRVFASHHLPVFMLRGEILYRLLFFRTDALLLGGLLALLLRGGHGVNLLRAARIAFATCLLTATVWIALNPYIQTAFNVPRYPSWIFTWGLSFIDIFAASALVMALETGSWTFRLLNLRPLRWLGRISYGAYVLHDIPHGIYIRIFKFSGNLVVSAAALAFLCTLVMAWLSFRFFESPFIRLKEKLTRRQGDRTVLAPVA